MANKELLTALELARVLGLSIETIWRYTREKRIPCIELASGQYRYLVEDVVSALNAGADGQVHEEPVDYVVGRKLTWRLKVGDDFLNLIEFHSTQGMI